MPLAWLSMETQRSRRSLKIKLCLGIKSFGPLSASTAAHCDTAAGFDVDCDWIAAIALIRGSGPPAKPIRQAGIQLAFGAPLAGRVRLYSRGLAWAGVVKTKSS